MTAVPSFAEVSLRSDSPEPPVTVAHATQRIEAAAKAHGYTPDQVVWETPEQIDVKPIYTRADRDGIAAACAAIGSLVDDVPLIVGGHSYGGRQASMLVAEQPGLAGGLFLSSYPLHPPGKPERLRIEHLGDVAVPTVVVHGRTDPFASSEELAAAVALINAPTRIVTVSAPHALNPALTGVAALAADAVDEVILRH